MASKFTVYTCGGSQWAQVSHLALAEKGIAENEYDVKEVDLFAADNFNPEYLKVNPNGTVPSITSPSLDKNIIESVDVVRWIDGLKGERTLVPADAAAKSKAQAIIDLVHSFDGRTDTVLFNARNDEEMNAKRGTGFKDYLVNRQNRLIKEKEANPGHPFYGPKILDNGSLAKFYTEPIGEEHKQFYKETDEAMKIWARELERLDSLLVLPYAVGNSVTEADIHVTTWLSHAMWGVGSDLTQIQNFDTLEKFIQKSAPDFKFGMKTREWWANITATESFKKVFPQLH
ncbi:hypothetical protein TGAM01_v204524 [Trichoderma gamsii]|uniref:Glutathione S-transferase n=1 Tax=Trichoderma gamsii TaxID=398673 RepID=A0A2P4ZQG0_9HYPO|nr:hypothetical protein TGAM01_v204524 [Trichoderma gamsii]PON26514.1 hypothetical protein TGAM01_v204524 [Trichoderma gamsii]